MSSLKLNFISVLSGNIIFTLAQWLVITLVTKKENLIIVGDYTLALAVIAPIILLSYFQFRSVWLTYEKFKFEFLFQIRILFLLVAIIVSYAAKQFFDIDSKIYFAVLVIKTLEGISDILHSVFQKEEKMTYISKSLFIRSLSLTFSIFLWYHFDLEFYTLLYLHIIFSLIFVLPYDVLNAQKFQNIGNFFIRINHKQFLSLVNISFHLAIVTLFISLNANVSKYVSENLLGREVQVVVSLFTYFLVAFGFVIRSMGQVLLPRLSKYFINDNYIKFKNTVINFLLFVTLMGVSFFLVSILSSQFFLKFLFNDKIASYNIEFNFFSGIAILMFITSALGYILTSIKKFESQAKIEIIAFVVNLISLLVLTPKFGLYGVLISFLTFYLLKTSFFIAVLIKVQNEKYSSFYR